MNPSGGSNSDQSRSSVVSGNPAMQQPVTFDALNTGPINGAGLDSDPESTRAIIDAEERRARSQLNADEKSKMRGRLFKFTILTLLLLVGGTLVFLRHSASNKNLNNNQVDAAQRFPVTSIPLGSISNNSSALSIQNAQTLSVNGQLNVNNSLVIAPTTRPSGAVTGQLYYDQTSNVLAYYNGTEFVNLNSNSQVVTNLGGASGTVATGSGLSVTNNTLNNTGVLTIQGTAGNVTLTGGPGLVVNGTTLSNSGLLSLGGQNGAILLGTGLSLSGHTLNAASSVNSITGTGNITVTNDGNGNYTISTSGQPGTGTVTSPGGTTGKLAVFDGAQDIADSLVSQSGGVVTVSGNLAVTGTLSLGSPLSVNQGGTGIGTLPTNSVLIGNGTSAISSVTASGSGQCLVSTAGAPTFQTCPGSGGVASINTLTGAITIQGASAGSISSAGTTVTINDATSAVKGLASFNSTNFTVTGGAVNTTQNINTGATPTFAGLNLGSPLTVGNGGLGLSALTANELLFASGTSTVGQLGNGTSGDCLVSNGAGLAPSFQACTGAGGVSSVDGLTGAITISNTTGVGSTITINNAKADGTTKGIVAFNGTDFTDNGAGVVNTIQGIAPTSTPTFAGLNLTTALAVASGGTGLSTLTANGILYASSTSSIGQLGVGTSGQCLVSNGAGVAPSFQTCTGAGGVSSLDGLTGTITLANSSGSAGTITINNAKADGSTKGIATFNSTNFTDNGSGVINTVQNIAVTSAPTFGQLTLTSNQPTATMLTINNTNTGATGNLLDLQVGGTSKLSVAPSGDLTTSGVINGQTISSTASFTGSVAVGTTLSVNTITPTSSLTVGVGTQAFTLQGNTSSVLKATNGTSTTTVGFQSPTANVTYSFAAAAAGSYDVCTTAGNCVGTGGGVTSPGGTTNTLAKFTGSNSIGNSIITDDGSTVTIGGALSVNTITPSGALTVGASGQNLALQGASVSVKATSGGITNSLVFATPATSNKTITLPNASGTVAVSASGPLSLDSAGNLTCPTCLTSGGGGGTSGVSSVDGLTGALTISNTTGSGSTITINNAKADGLTLGLSAFNSTNFIDNGSGVINTVQDIATTSSVTFSSVTATTLSGNGAAVTSVNAATLQGNAASFFTNASNISSGTLGDTRLSSNVALYNRATSNFTGALQQNGNNVCTVAGNCSGTAAGGIGGGGTANTIAMFTGSGYTVGDSLLTEDAGHTTVTVTGDLSVTGAVSAATLSGNGSGVTNVDAIKLNGQSASYYLNATNINAGTLGDSYLTSNVALYNRATSNFTGALQQGGNNVCTVAGNCAGTAAGGIGGGGTANTLAMFTGSGYTIADSMLAENAGHTTVTVTGALTVTGAISAASLSGNGSGVTNVDAATLQGNAASYFTNASNISSGTLGDSRLSSNVALYNRVTSNFTGALQQGGNNVCTVAGNCAGTAAGGIGGSGTANTIAMFNGSGYTITDSLLTEDAGHTTVTVTGALTVTGAVTAASFSGNGASVTNVNAATLQGNAASFFTNASNISSGTLGDTFLSSNVALYNRATSNFTGTLQHSGNTVCDNSNNCGYLTGSAANGSYVQLAPSSAQSDSSANASILINDTGGGNLIQLESSAVNKFVVDNSGNVTAAGTLQVGAGNGLDTSASGALILGSTHATSISLSQNTSLAAGKIFTNNGATVNTTLALGNFAAGGSIGSAATTVDIYTSISVAQTTASQTLSIPSPTASTTYGKLLYLSNIGSADFIISGTSIPLRAGATTTLVWSNTNGGASWQFAGTDGSSILNQNSTTQSANFNINGTGQAGTFTANTFSSTGNLAISAGSSANSITIGGSNGATISLGSSNDARTINIGNTAGSQAQTIVIGDNATSTSTTTVQGANGVSLLTNSSSSGVIVQSATNSTIAFKVQNSGSTALLTGDTVNNQVIIGTSSGAVLQNYGATLDTAVALGNFSSSGSLGTAASTVDIHTSFTIAQTTAGVTLTIPSPTTTTAGRIIYIANLSSSTQSIVVGGVTLGVGTNATFFWNGTTWSSTAVSTGVTLVGTFSGSSIANGASISGNTITFGPADTTNPGMVSTGTQSFAGSKTFKVTSTAAFQIQNASSSTSIFSADTTNGRITISGTSNYTQFVIKNSASQTESTPQVVLQDSTGSELGRISDDDLGNLFFGYFSGSGITTGNDNTGVGNLALQSVTSGSQNTAFGLEALQSLQTGNGNTVIGDNAASVLNGASFNVAIGNNALGGVVGAGGDSNVAIGSNAGSVTGAGSSFYGNVFVGALSGSQDNSSFVTRTDVHSSVAIGVNAQVQQSNTIVIGGISGGDNQQVVIGSTMATSTNPFGVSPVFDNSGTAAQSGSTVTGTTTNWVSDGVQVGMRVIFADGTDGGTITAVNSNTSLTVSSSQTVSRQNYRIHSIGFQVTSVGNAYLQNTSTTAFQIQNSGGTSLFIADTSNATIKVSGTTGTFAILQLDNAHVRSTQTTAPTASTPTSCGTSPTGAVTSGSTDAAGSFTLTSGSGSTSSSCQIVINFNKSYPAAPKSVVVTGASANASKMTPAVTATTSTTFTVVLPQTDALSTAYQFYYWVVD